MGTRLIVNADDFGLSPAINRGIVNAHRAGIVTSASIMANGPAFDHAVELARSHPQLDLGVHLTLTELAPVAAAETVTTLVNGNGRFAPHATGFTLRYLRGAIALEQVRTELEAQIRRVRSQGLEITHLDGHQHVHALPGIARVVNDLARQYGVRAVRYPREPLSGYTLKAAGMRRTAEQLALNAVCMVSPLRAADRCDRFAGFCFGGRLDEANLLAVLNHLPESGTVELMCHPAEAEAEGPQARWGYAGTDEIAALTSPRVRQLVASRGIELIGYRDL